MKNRLHILIIALLSLAPLFWFRKGLLIAGGDGPVFINPVNYLQNFVRYPVADLNGVLPFEVCLIFPFLLFFQFCHYIGLSLIASEKILFILYFFTAGMSMHYLMSVILCADSAYARIAKLIASLFYMFNYFVIILTPLLAQFIAYALLPLILGLYIKGIHGENNIMRGSILFVCSLSFLPIAFSNPPFLAMVFLILGLYTAYDLIVISRFANFMRVTKFVLLSASLYSLINVWFLSVWYMYFNSAGGVSEAILPAYWNPGSTLDKTFALHGSWAWNEVYFPFYNFFEKTLFKAAVYIIPAAVFAILKAKIKSLKIYFFLLISFVGIFLAKGRWGLFGSIYAYLFDHCPMFWMFREPHAKFTLLTVLGYSVLLGVSVSAVAELVCSNSRKLKERVIVSGTAAFAAGFICVNAWPAFTGDIIFDRRGDIPGFRVKVPDYWQKTADYFNSQKGDFRIIELPYNTWASVWLGWEEGFASGGNPVNFLFNKSSIHSPSLNLVSRQFYLQLREGSSNALYKLLQMLNVKYIFQRNDYLWKTLRTDSPEKVKEMLAKQEQIFCKQSFGKIDVYESRGASSIFSAADKLTGVFGGGGALGAMSVFYDIDKMGLYFFGQSGPEKDRQYMRAVSKIIFFNSSIEDAARYMIDGKYKVIPSGFLKWGDADIEKGWAPAADFGREPFNEEERARLSDNYMSSLCGVFTASGKPLNMKYLAERKGRYVVLARYAEFDGAKLRMKIDSKQVTTEVEDKAPDELYWRECGRVSLEEGAHDVSLVNEGGRVFVDAVIIATEEALSENEDAVMRLLEERNIAVDYVFKSSGKGADEYAVRIEKKGMYRVATVPRKEGRTATPMEMIIDGTAADPDRREGLISWYAAAFDAGLHHIKAKNGLLYAQVFSAGEDNPRAYPRISYEKYGSVRYLLEIQEMAEPFFLIFKDQYDSNWELYRIKGPELGFGPRKFDLFSFFRNKKNLARIDKQYLVHGYSNAYYLDLPAGGRFFLENRMQRVFESSVLISLATSAICFIIFASFGFKK